MDNRSGDSFILADPSDPVQHTGHEKVFAAGASRSGPLAGTAVRMEALPQPPELHPSQRREKDHAMHDIPVDGQSHKLVPQRVSRRQVLALAGAAGVGWIARRSGTSRTRDEAFASRVQELRLAARLQHRAVLGRADRRGLVVVRWSPHARRSGVSASGACQLSSPVDRILRLDAQPEQVTAHFLDAVAAIAEAGMKVMPCLFNRWHDFSWDYGGTYTEHLYRNWQPMVEYVGALVKPLANDSRVLIWDLCNEPQAQDLGNEVNQREFAWLQTMATAVRQQGAQQPITIGTMSGGNIDTFAPLCDVLCGHPYAHDQARSPG